MTCVPRSEKSGTRLVRPQQPRPAHGAKNKGQVNQAAADADLAPAGLSELLKKHLPVERVEVLFVGKKAGQRRQHHNAQNPLAFLQAFSISQPMRSAWQCSLMVCSHARVRERRKEIRCTSIVSQWFVGIGRKRELSIHAILGTERYRDTGGCAVAAATARRACASRASTRRLNSWMTRAT